MVTFMSREKITISKNLPFKTEIPVLVEHINLGGHLGNDSYLAIVHEARIRFLESKGFSELSLYEDIGLVLTDSYIRYKQETFRGDLLEVFVGVDNITHLEGDFYYRLYSTRLKKDIALAKTGCAFFNYKTRKLAKIPESIIEKLTS